MNNAESLNRYYGSIENLLASVKTENQLHRAIVNAPFHNKLHTTMLDLGIVVLLKISKDGKTVDRIALSETEPAQWAVRMTPIPFNEIKIPIDNKENIIVKAIKSKRHQKTSDWKYLFVPALSDESARFNQAGAGIACSFVYPLIQSDKAVGAMIFSYYQPLEHIDNEHHEFMKRYCEIVQGVLR